MPRQHETVEDLISAVRGQIDEENQESVDDTRDILPALNRAQEYASDILARFYQDPLLKHTSVTLTTGTEEYDIPEDALEDRLEHVEITIQGQQRPIQRINYRDISEYESTNTQTIPSYYCVVGRKYRLVPPSDGSYSARIWYLLSPDKLVIPQGRVQLLNTSSNYVVLDAAGDDLTTNSDNLENYVNVVDRETGLIKITLQVLSISGARITFRSTPLRTTVLGRTISGSFTTSDIQKDDYLSTVQGTCVVQPLGGNVVNFIIEYAVNEMKRKLDLEVIPEERLLDKLEKQVSRSYVGREQTFRVRKTSKIWGPVRRFWTRYTTG